MPIPIRVTSMRGGGAIGVVAGGGLVSGSGMDGSGIVPPPPPWLPDGAVSRVTVVSQFTRMFHAEVTWKVSCRVKDRDNGGFRVNATLNVVCGVGSVYCTGTLKVRVTSCFMNACIW